MAKLLLLGLSHSMTIGTSWVALQMLEMRCGVTSSSVRAYRMTALGAAKVWPNGRCRVFEVNCRVNVSQPTIQGTGSHFCHVNVLHKTNRT